MNNEIEAVIKNIPKSKISGPDRFTCELLSAIKLSKKVCKIPWKKLIKKNEKL